MTEGGQRGGQPPVDPSDRIPEIERDEPTTHHSQLGLSAEQEELAKPYSVSDGWAGEEACELQVASAVLQLKYEVGFELLQRLPRNRSKSLPEGVLSGAGAEQERSTSDDHDDGCQEAGDLQLLARAHRS